jgi:hypothetical protein
MKKPGLIIALSLIAIAGATGIYFVLKKDKNKPPNPDPKGPPTTPPKGRPAQFGPVQTKPGQTTPGPTNVTPGTFNQHQAPAFDPLKYANTKAYKDLKENLRLGYYSMELVCNPNGTNAPLNCNTKTPISPGLAQGVWLQYVRAGKRFAREFHPEPEVQSDPNFKAWGNKEIAKFNQKTDQLFPPKYFNTNQPFYAEYLSKGGTPIPV